MRIIRLVFLVSIIALLGACSCRTKSVGQGNIPLAEEGNILEDIHFAFDRYDLSETARGILKANSSWLQENPDATSVIEGHCDERGTQEYNMALGQKRAQAAYDYLRGLGIASDRMSTVSYGEELPLDPRHTEEAWAKNRRAHFRVQQ